MNGKAYFLDLTTTNACNFKCSYCFEYDNTNSKRFSLERCDLLIKRIYELLDSDFIKKNFDFVLLNFWGGEPTLNSEFIKTIFNEFRNNNRIAFLIYTNGSNISTIYSISDSVKNESIFGYAKFMTQISYDGMPVHDICRKTKDGKLTSHIVRNAILEFDRNRLPYTIKATIPPSALKYISLCYQDIFDIYISNQRPGWRNDNYFPTVDLYHFDQYSDQELDLFENDLKDELIKISVLDLKYKKDSGKFFFSWFMNNKAICSAGQNLACMESDGKIYKCHGCLYQDDKDKNEHYVTSIDEPNFVNKLEESYHFHSKLMSIQPSECMNCTTPFCLRCNAAKFSDSKKESYSERWTDYSIHSRLCRIFKINEKIVMALNRINN